MPHRGHGPGGIDPRGVSGRHREGHRIHSRRRHLPGGAQSAPGDALRFPPARTLPHAAGGEPEPVHVLPADPRSHAGRQFARDHGPRGGRQRHRATTGGHASAGQDTGGGRGPRRGPAGRPQGAGGTRDAHRSGPQRRGPGVEHRVGGAQRRDVDRAVQPRDAHHEQCHRPTRPGHDSLRRPAGLPAGGHGLRGPQDPGHADHRRTGAPQARTLRWSRGLHRLQRRDGHLHRPADGGDHRRQGLRAVGRRDCGRQRAGE